MSKLNAETQKAVDALAKVMSESEEFGMYREAKSHAISDPEKMELIRQAQVLREKLYAIPENEVQSEYAVNLHTEYEELMEDTVVYKYTKAELAVADICRKVFAGILDAMEF